MNQHFAHSGAWGLALIMIVVASWFLYRYLAPKSWREWASAGLVQAFIIALYAEMYGFPLTIYFLVRFFGLDRRYLSANLWSTLLGYGETGMMISMILGYALLFIGIGIFIEGWRELYRARQENRLVTNGLYAFVRHSAIHRPFPRSLRRGHRTLADFFLGRAFSGDCDRLHAARAEGGAADDRAVR